MKREMKWNIALPYQRKRHPHIVRLSVCMLMGEQEGGLLKTFRVMDAERSRQSGREIKRELDGGNTEENK